LERYYRGLLRTREVTVSQVERMFTEGIIDLDRLKEEYANLGYTDEYITLLGQSIALRVLREEQRILRTELIKAFKEVRIPEPDFEEMLGQLKLTAEEVRLLKEAGFLHIHMDIVKTKIDGIARRYEEGLIDEPTLEMELKDLNLSDRQVSLLMELIKARREARIEILTAGILRAALREGVIDENYFIELMEGLGWRIEDLEIITELERGRLTLGILRMAFRYEVIDEDKFRERLKELRFTDEDIEILVELEKKRRS